MDPWYIFGIIVSLVVLAVIIILFIHKLKAHARYIIDMDTAIDSLFKRVSALEAEVESHKGYVDAKPTRITLVEDKKENKNG